MSAMLDGESAGIDERVVADHLAACQDCHAWRARVATLTSRAAVDRLASTPDLTGPVLLALGAPRARRITSEERWVRAALAVVAVLVPVTSVGDVLVAREAGARHLALEFGSLQVALAMGFLFVALRPARAWGMLPLVVFAVGATIAVNAVDLVAGHIAPDQALDHVAEVAGLALMIRLCRLAPRWPASTRPA